MKGNGCGILLGILLILILFSPCFAVIFEIFRQFVFN